MYPSTIIIAILSIILCTSIHQTLSYSVIEDESIIRSHLEKLRQKPPRPTNHAKIARDLVHKSKWASVGTISTDDVIEGFPMVNIVSIADGINNDKSTGVIYFLSTILDFTGKDLLVHNKTTFMISDDEDLHCSKQNMDPMEPTCPRIHITGSVIEMNESFEDYNIGFKSVVNLHPAAAKWIKAHNFNLCKVNIENIYVLDYYGGPHRVLSKEYYAAVPDQLPPSINNLDVMSEKRINDLENSIDYYSTDNQVNIKIEKNKYKKINIFV